MQTQNRFFDDLARMAGGTLGLLTGLRTEVEAMVRQQLQRLLGDMQLVSREEFEAVKEMAAKARLEQEIAEKRLAALEEAIAKNSGTRRG
ncbi:MAG: accessory factor UbiK family protein [Alphaproteobacteria bacterium]